MIEVKCNYIDAKAKRHCHWRDGNGLCSREEIEVEEVDCLAACMCTYLPSENEKK